MLITKSDKQFLLHNESPHKLSILIPTNRYNESHDFGKDQIYLRNAIKDVRLLLEGRIKEERDIRKFLAPINALLNQKEFWKHLSDGLAICATPNEMRYFTLPRKFTPFTSFSNHFHITPICNFLADSKKYFILKLDLGGVSFFEASNYSITPVRINDLIPKNLDEIINQNDPEKTLQTRTSGTTMFHGHKPIIEKRDHYIEQYYRAVDEGIMKILFDEKAPLVLVGLSEQIATYETINSYPYLTEKHVIGNINAPLSIQRETKELLTTYLNNALEKALNALDQIPNNKVAHNLQVLPQLATEGMIDTLVIKDTSPIWGKWKGDSYSELYEEATHSSECLLNRTLHTVLKNGGKAFTIDNHSRKTITQHPVSAILRYNY